MKNSTPSPSAPVVSIRVAGPDDHADLRRLAALDSAPVPTGPFLIGSVDGLAVAAVSVATGHAVADPFAHTADLVTLLRLRAEHLRGPARGPDRLGLRHLALALRRRGAAA
ncbi:MAG: hypothetical protein JWM31_833 [Solirubrobacterales bacterium]|nr:hypothetical protein [Solirubrobacterales bacterium]